MRIDNPEQALKNTKPAKQKKTRQNKGAGKPPSRLWRWVKSVFLIGFVLGLCALVFIIIFVIRATRDLPSLEVLRDYSPAVMSRVHAGDGKLIAEYGIEKRVFVPISSIPKDIQHALVASEDQRFYKHNGFDPKGFSRAMLANIKHKLKGQRLEGGSTLTQQVAKHFVVGDARNIERKIRDIFIAKRIEKVFSKDQILELYLNDVYFGRRAYGIAGAALNYFNKPLDDLSLGEMAYLAGLVKGPNNYQIADNYDRAIARRNYVLSRMVEDGYVSKERADKAKAEKLVLGERLHGDEYLAAEYFVAEVRKQIGELYGEEELNTGGLSIRTTLDTKMQLAARKALRRGLEMYDRRHGWRGPLAVLPEGEDWKDYLANFKAPPDIGHWKLGLVLNVTQKSAEIGFANKDADGKIDTTKGVMNLVDIDWAGKALPKGHVGRPPKSVKDVVQQGDIILVEAKPNPKGRKALENTYNLRQIPNVNGGIIAMDPHTGRVLALVGGYSFQQSQFNRATQAYRQPGSAFKPFVYAAALDSGFTPASQILDAPFVIERGDTDCIDHRPKRRGILDRGLPKPKPAPQLRGSSDTSDKKDCGPLFYKPANFNAGKWYGLSTLRLGLEKSRNAMTVRLANDIGMGIIGRYGKKFAIYDEPKPELAWALGAGETTLLRMASAYAAIDNGGKKITPTLLDRVQNNKGVTIYKHDKRVCPECQVDEWVEGLKPPVLPDEREQILDPVTAYQMTSLLEGVVQRGTGRQMLRLERPLAGKTGTTNDFKDAWFMGFSPDLVTGVYVGFDTPRTLGGETGAKAAGPIWRFFMGDALKGRPKVSFRIPEGVLLAPVDATTGEPSFIGAPNFIYEAFKPGTEPKLGEDRSKVNIKGNTGFEDYDFGFGSKEAGEAPQAGAEDTPSSPDTAETGGSKHDKKPDISPDGQAQDGQETEVLPQKDQQDGQTQDGQAQDRHTQDGAEKQERGNSLPPQASSGSSDTQSESSGTQDEQNASDEQKDANTPGQEDDKQAPQNPDQGQTQTPVEPPAGAESKKPKIDPAHKPVEKSSNKPEANKQDEKDKDEVDLDDGLY